MQSWTQTELAKTVGCNLVIDYKKQDFAQSDTKYDVILGINGCNSMKKYKKPYRIKGICGHR